MEALKEFLDNMFRGVDESTDVLRAKAELLQMMEDKYEMLLADGKNENEAVGIVISEFGNFQEIADELGISDAVKGAAGMQEAEAAKPVESVQAEEPAEDVSEPESVVEEAVVEADEPIAETSDDVTDGAGEAAGTGDTANAGFAAGAATAAGMAAGAAGAAFTGAQGDAAGAQNAGAQGGPNYGNNANNYAQNNKKRPRRWLNWSLEDIESYLKFARSHARFVACAIALCILAPYINSVLETVLSMGAPKVVVEAISDSAFFGCIACAVAFFIVAANQTKRYGDVNKDAVSLNGGAQMELQMADDEWAGRRTGCIVLGVIFIILGPAASSLGGALPGFIGEIVDDSVLLFTAIGVAFLVYSTSVTDRFRELSKGIKKASENDPNTYDGEVYGTRENTGAYGQAGAAGQAGDNAWTYRRKKGMPTWLLVLLIILAFLTINTGLNIFRGLPVLSGYKGCGRFFGGKLVAVDDKQTFDADGIKKISVNLSASELLIDVSEQDQVTVECNGEFGEKPVVKNDGGELRIGEESDFNLFGWKTGDGKVKLKVPKDAVISYDLDLSMGDVKVQGLGDVNAIQADVFDADLSAGKLSLKYVTAHQMDVDLSAGDLELEGVKCDGKSDFDLSAGAATIRSSDLYKVDADLALGSFEYELPEPKAQVADKYALDLDVSLGNIVFLDEKNGDEIKRDAKDASDEERYFKVDASLGSITIR